MYFLGDVEKTNSDKSVCKGFENYKAKTMVSGVEEGSKWDDWEKQPGIPGRWPRPALSCCMTLGSHLVFLWLSFFSYKMGLLMILA